jgi:orotate phosphoribosyltransferase
MIKSDSYIIEKLKHHKALLEGHFILTSGRRSAQYVQFARIHEYPDAMKEFGDMLAEKIKLKCEELNLKIDCIASPAIGAIVPGYQLASSLGVERYIFCERNQNGEFEFRRNFEIISGQSYLIVEDVITTGKSFLELAKLIEDRGGRVVMVSSFIDRTNGKTFDYPFVSLISLEIPSYDVNELPDHLTNIPPVKPGSRVIV